MAAHVPPSGQLARGHCMHNSRRVDSGWDVPWGHLAAAPGQEGPGSRQQLTAASHPCPPAHTAVSAGGRTSHRPGAELLRAANAPWQRGMDPRMAELATQVGPLHPAHVSGAMLKPCVPLLSPNRSKRGHTSKSRPHAKLWDKERTSLPQQQ